MRDVAVVKAEQDQKVQVVKAEADKETTIRIAAGNLQATLNDAEGVTALGVAKAAAEKAMLMAPVDAQITLATEIGENEGYQAYLVQVEQIKAGQAVGIEMAGALRDADLKIIANSGDVQAGVTNLAGILSPAGGTSIAGMMAALSQLPEGKALVEKLTS
jgi:flotillin